MMPFALILLSSFFSTNEPDTLVESWVDKQVETLSKSEADNPAEQSKALFRLVYVTQHVTADRSTLSSDWGRVTSDGVESFPASADPYDLADRMRRVCKKLKWSVSMADSDLGPVMIFGKGDRKQCMLIRHGQYGLWKNYQRDKSSPEAVSQARWQNLIKARKALLEFKTGDKKAFEGFKFDDPQTPLMTQCALLSGKDFSLKELSEFVAKWPKMPIFALHALKKARADKDKIVIRKLITLGLKHPNIPFLIEATYAELTFENKDYALDHLSSALKINPFHAQTLQLMRAIKGQ